VWREGATAWPRVHSPSRSSSRRVNIEFSDSRRLKYTTAIFLYSARIPCIVQSQEVAMSRQVSDSSDSPDPGESYEEPVKGAKSLVKMAEQALLRHFKLCVDGLNSPLNYCCGGAALIPASADESAREYSPRRPDELEAPQIVLRWDMPDDDCTRKIQFPLRINSKGLTPAGEKDTQTMQDLLKAMMPSTLKRKREGTSEENLQFGKLNKQQFSVDFDPYECGIIDAISQVLLPRYYLDEMCERQEHQGIVARLRALHVSLLVVVINPRKPSLTSEYVGSI